MYSIAGFHSKTERGVNTIDEMADAYCREHARQEGYDAEDVRNAYISGAKHKREELIRWNDPKYVSPKPHKDILVKCSDGQIEVDFYSPKLDGFFIEHSTGAEVIGWREIH